MKPEVYAKAMFDLSTAGKSADDIISGTIKSLKSRGALGLLPKILSSYQRLTSEADTQGSKLTVAREADIKVAMESSGAAADIQVVIDEALVGGYRLESNGKLVDNSFKAKLLAAYRNTVKA